MFLKIGSIVVRVFMALFLALLVALCIQEESLKLMAGLSAFIGFYWLFGLAMRSGNGQKPGVIDPGLPEMRSYALDFPDQHRQSREDSHLSVGPNVRANQVGKRSRSD